MLETSARLLSLLSLLQARRDWPGPLLAERLEVSARTVRRDVDRLRDLGYPVQATKGPEGGYRLDAGTELPPLLFDDEQAVAVAVALQTATSTVTGIGEGSARALATVRQVMPARLRHRVDALQVTAVDRTGGPAGAQRRHRGAARARHRGARPRGAAVRLRGGVRARRATTPPSAAGRRRAGWSRTTWSPGAGAGTSWRSTWTAPTGAPSGSTGSVRAPRPARGSPRASCPRAT